MGIGYWEIIYAGTPSELKTSHLIQIWTIDDGSQLKKKKKKRDEQNNIIYFYNCCRYCFLVEMVRCIFRIL